MASKLSIYLHSADLAIPDGASPEEDFDAWALSDKGGAGSALLVRFEISIVKVCVSILRLCARAQTSTFAPILQVTWLGLNGIQFRRIGGDGWQYQMLAKRILVEMRL